MIVLTLLTLIYIYDCPYYIDLNIYMTVLTLLTLIYI